MTTHNAAKPATAVTVSELREDDHAGQRDDFLNGTRDGADQETCLQCGCPLQARRALERLRRNLEAAGSDFQHVAMINSFHLWQGPNFNGTRDQQFAAFEEVIGEFMKAPYPAWTAVGTTGLLGDGGIVEVQLIARVRQE